MGLLLGGYLCGNALCQKQNHNHTAKSGIDGGTHEKKAKKSTAKRLFNKDKIYILVFFVLLWNFSYRMQHAIKKAKHVKVP